MVFGMMNGFGWLWPFGMAFTGAWLIVSILLLAFWIWMIVDAAQRTFRNGVEKIVWLVVIVLGGWVGALVYLLVVRMYNPHGLAKK